MSFPGQRPDRESTESGFVDATERIPHWDSPPRCLNKGHASVSIGDAPLAPGTPSPLPGLCHPCGWWHTHCAAPTMKSAKPLHRVNAICACAIALTCFYALQILDWRLLPIQLPLLVLPVLIILTSSWYYAKHQVRVAGPEMPLATVDVFVTSCGEDPSLIDSTLRAARDMRGQHNTWLLDDASSTQARKIADELGVGYLAREGNRDYKAGNLNNALSQTDGDIVVIFDVDHKPNPEFLERSLPHFVDSRIGFAQVMLTFSSQNRSWTSKAAIETTHEYFNLISPGKDAYNAASLMGSNALIRRSALEDINGYKPGLAEDLETSVALHAAGWHSVYVAEPLAPGLAPEDYRGFAKQQAKWSRGVMEAAINALRGPFWELNSSQKAAYLLRFSYYLAAPVAFLGSMLVALSVMLNFTRVESNLRLLLPFLIAAAVIRTVAHRSLAITPEARTGILMRGNALVMASWPVYLTSLWATLRRTPTRFVETPKSRSKEMQAFELIPQLAALCFTIAAITASIFNGTLASMPIAASFCLIHAASYSALLPSTKLPRPLRRALSSGGLTRLHKALLT